MDRFKFVIKVWSCVWLLVTLLSMIIQHVVPSLPLLFKTMIISAIMVPAMVFLIIPLIGPPVKS